MRAIQQMQRAAMTGRLFVVAIHIGNTEDLTARSVRILRNASRIACESLSRAKILLKHLDIPFNKSSLIVLKDVHEDAGTSQVLRALDAGHEVALVVDAGTPLISDPGFRVVRETHSRGIATTPVPGASSLTALASVSPIPLNTFKFIGFLRSRGEAKRSQLADIGDSQVPTIFFETSKRVLATLRTWIDLGFGNREVFLGRELTKTHEELLYGSVADVCRKLENRPQVLGEFVGVLAESTVEIKTLEADSLIRELLPHVKPAQIARIVANVTSLPRDEAYLRTTELRERLS